MSIRIYRYYPNVTPEHLVGHPQSELVAVASEGMRDEVERAVAKKNRDLEDAGALHRVGFSTSDTLVFTPGQAVAL